jgi:hypothetical protein
MFLLPRYEAREELEKVTYIEPFPEASEMTS